MNARLLLLPLLVAYAVAAVAQPSYDYETMQRESLGRGVVAWREGEGSAIVSWRYLSTDPLETAFNIYRDNEKIALVPPISGTFYRDEYDASVGAVYEVRPVVAGEERRVGCGRFAVPPSAAMGYINIPLDRPADGVTPAGERYSYTPNDASVGDVDGDGEYEIILKWLPTNAHDNAYDGYTGNVLMDCYRLTGERLWRIDLGHNIRAGAHYTPFIVFDFDGDGCAELAMRTADGTMDGKGYVIGDASADWREVGDVTMPRGGDFPSGDPRGVPRPDDPPYGQGRIASGNEYLTIFDGLTGRALQTIDYVPSRGDIAAWGDMRPNRCDRFLACVAYLDGRHPSLVMCRGYYTRTVLVAFDWDGKEISQRWVFDSDDAGYEAYAGQGNHNLRVGDVDGDGRDEIVYGACVIDHDGTGLYSTGLGHGDALQMTQFAKDMVGLQVWDCHENCRDGSSFRDAATGDILFQLPDTTDVGRCMAADIDPNNPGLELWSLASYGIRNVRGEVVDEQPDDMPTNMAVWWDGDLLRELLDFNEVSKYDYDAGTCRRMVLFDGAEANNGTKGVPCLQGDIMGDWREEVLLRSADNDALRLYVSPIDTDYRFYTFLEDPVYRISLATQNVGYNQPTQVGFYFGPDLKEGFFRGYVFKNE